MIKTSNAIREVGEKEQTKLYLQKVIDILDEAWQNKEYPNRNYLLSRMPEFGSEDDMIYFLKKHGIGNLYSFFIKVNKPEFTLPILISRRYLRNEGKKLLIQTRSEIDKQRRVSQVPDQEKYDILTHVERFLETKI